MAILIEGKPRTTEGLYQINGASEKVKREALRTFPHRLARNWMVLTTTRSGEKVTYQRMSSNESGATPISYKTFVQTILPEIVKQGEDIQYAELWVTAKGREADDAIFMADGLEINHQNGDTIDLRAPSPQNKIQLSPYGVTQGDAQELSYWMSNLKEFRDQELARKAAIAPSHISSRVLEALGGTKEMVNIDGKEVALVNDGAYLWGTEDRDKGKGILNHVLLTRRTALALASALKEQQAPGFENIDLGYVADAATLHDVTKLYGEDRERLTPEQKSQLGLPENFREIMDEVDEVGVEWLRNLGFPVEVYGAIMSHDFPVNIVDNPYWKIVLVADYMSGQQIMTVDQRLNDVRTRWIDEKLANGEAPRIEPERFTVAEQNIKAVAAELFGAIGLEDRDFIEVNQLNSPAVMDRGEQFIRRTAERKIEDRARRAVRQVEAVAASGNYGKIDYHNERLARDPQHTH